MHVLYLRHEQLILIVFYRAFAPLEQVNLLIRDPGMYPLYVVTDIQHYPGKEIKDEGEAHRQKG